MTKRNIQYNDQKEHIVCSFWSLYCMFFLVIILYVLLGHYIVCSFWSLYCMLFLENLNNNFHAFELLHHKRKVF
jgi:hypothetical protein